ncbi:hypothetical protein JW758_01775 [Candidatus Peregrinibacteria bacterium]|nr:hypothetical protein [Candidatus Peregrinibacteria bacterium]
MFQSKAKSPKTITIGMNENIMLKLIGQLKAKNKNAEKAKVDKNRVIIFPYNGNV